MKKLLLLLYVLTLLTAGLFAQSITLEQVRSMALANSRSLARLNLSVQSTDLNEKDRIYTYFVPTPSLGASASISLWNPTGAGPLNNPFDTFNARGSFSVSQAIFQGGKALVQKAINEIASESARKDALAEYFNVLDSADSAYYTVLESAAYLDAAESALQNSIASLNIAEVRHTNGMINQADYLQALADKESKENSRNQARRALALNTSKLKSLIGAADNPQPEEIDFSGYEDLIQRLGNTTDENFDSLYNQLYTQVSAANPSLSKYMLATKMADENVKMSQRGYSPTVSMSFSTGLNYNPSNSNAAITGYGSGLKQTGGSLSLGVNIPLDFWSIENSVAKNKIAQKQAALDFASATDQTETDLQSDLISALSNAETVISSRRAYDYAEKNFELIQEGYRLNKNSITDLTTASALLFTNRSSLISSQYGFLQSLSTLRSLGAIDDEQKLIKTLMGN